MGVIADGYRGMLMSLLPPGRVWQFVGSLLTDFFAACALELERLHGRVADLLGESNPATTVELVPEYEAELDGDASGILEERQARIVARLIARQRYRPVDFETALAPLFGQLAADVVVMERTHAMALAIGDQREIYRFFLYRDPTLPGLYFVDSAQQLVDAIKPSHTLGYVIESVDFCCDDAFSLCDRDLLGA